MIHFAIQDHGSGQSLPALVELLAAEGDSIDLSFDGPEETLEQIRQTLGGAGEALSIRRSAPLSWSSFESALVILESMALALHHPDWSYYMNLSGSCLPLMPPQAMHKRLANEARNGRLGFCTGYRLARPVHWISSQAPAAPLPECLPYAQGRAQLLVDPSLGELVETHTLQPSRNIGQRIGLNYTETSKNRYWVRPLSPLELCTRAKFLAIHPFYYGRSWVILHRSIVEWLVSSSLLTRVKDVLKGCFCADEIILPMCLFSQENPFLDVMCSDNLRYRQGGAKRFDLAELPDLLHQQRHLVARKVFPADYRTAADQVAQHKPVTA